MHSSQKLDYQIICSTKCQVYLDVEIEGLSFANFLVVYDKNVDWKDESTIDSKIVYSVDKKMQEDSTINLSDGQSLKLLRIKQQLDPIVVSYQSSSHEEPQRFIFSLDEVQDIDYASAQK